MKIAVMGAGAVGCYFGAMLARAGHEVVLIGRPTHVDAIRAKGQAEADAKMGMISYSSPLGRALIGRQVGDEVEVSVPSGDKFYLVEKIEFI